MKNPTLFFSYAELVTKIGDETDRLYIERPFKDNGRIVWQQNQILNQQQAIHNFSSK